MRVPSSNDVTLQSGQKVIFYHHESGALKEGVVQSASASIKTVEWRQYNRHTKEYKNVEQQYHVYYVVILRTDGVRNIVRDPWRIWVLE